MQNGATCIVEVRRIPTKSYWVTKYKTSSSTIVLHNHGNVFAYPFSTRNLAL